MRVSAAVRRGIGFTATATLAAGGVLVVAAPVASAAQASISNVGYTCKADNVLIDQTIGGPQQFKVDASAPLPDTLTSGATIPVTSTNIDLILPPELVKNIRERMQVTRVAGTASSKVVIQGVSKESGALVEELTPDVIGLRSGGVNVPASGSVKIEATGTVEAINVPEFPAGDGLVYVSLPATFTLNALLDPPVLNQGTEANPAKITCKRNENSRASRVIGTIPVGNGCSETECPLPAEGSASNPGGGDGGGNGGGGNNGGGGSGEDPSAPGTNTNSPDGNGGNGNGGNGNGGNGNGNGGDGSGVAPTATTSLPATGSPIGLGLIALLGLAAAGRLALAVRTRRRAKTA